MEIDAWIFDEHQIRRNGISRDALPVSDVKVAVDPQQATRAREILLEDRSGALREIPEQDLPADHAESCPRCGVAASREATRQRFPGPIQWLVSLLFLVLGFVVPRRRFIVGRSCELVGPLVRPMND